LHLQFLTWSLLMTLAAFKRAIDGAPDPPEKLPELLKALWHDARSDWDKAHHIAQKIETSDGAWVHAYLHRKEGDRSNALYWYRRAGRPECRASLPEEWDEIARYLLNASE
jgi:hypothetical protein